jgi:hypothetical protein
MLETNPPSPERNGILCIPSKKPIRKFITTVCYPQYGTISEETREEQGGMPRRRSREVQDKRTLRNLI